MFWTGIPLSCHSNLRMFHRGSLTCGICRKENVDPYVRPYAGTTDDEFILIDSKFRSYRDSFVHRYLEGKGVERID